ncbi:hypothetical protein [Streptomyces profundus]|uniref:hypothetical protein n=1 Tax=Streptomyces profundus TaxID=2867410 RepID=UPI001D16B895|nr:hypothetical protein [Streptomyces sp. MA3_2.13]UED84551.1 hypothetical protein K4G22_10325 [Streptomyces sp. MA3_2.13]
MSQPWQQQPDGGHGGQQPPQQPGGYPQYGQPPQQPQQPQQPYGQPPQPGYGYPQQPQGYPQQPGQPAQPGQGFPHQQPGPGFPPQQPHQPGPYGAPGGGFPPPPRPSGPTGNPGLAILAGLGAMLVVGFVYALIYNGLYDEEADTFRQMPYLSLLVGAGVAVGPAFLAKRNYLVWGFAAVFAVLASFGGELYGTAMAISDVFGQFGESKSAIEMLFEEFDFVWDVWEFDRDFVNYLFLLLSGGAAVGVCASVSRRS